VSLAPGTRLAGYEVVALIGKGGRVVHAGRPRTRARPRRHVQCPPIRGVDALRLTASDPLTYRVVGATLIVVTLLASLRPARRASIRWPLYAPI